MESSDPQACFIVPAATTLYQELLQLATTPRLVFFAGLPGTGKSLLLQQLTHLVGVAGRTAHLLQWDVVRPVFETSAAGQRYPVVEGVTHGVIRLAAGWWARHAVAQWYGQYPETEHLLIGETPFIGNRFIELARPHADAAEEHLGAASCRFVIPVPSPEIRQHIEATRVRRHIAPLHQQEKEDAPPQVLHALWQELCYTALRLGMTVGSPGQNAPLSYNPGLYKRVYQALLTHRHCHVITLDMLLPTADVSVYDFAVERREVVPTSDEAGTFIREVEARYPDQEALQYALDHWSGVSPAARRPSGVCDHSAPSQT